MGLADSPTARTLRAGDLAAVFLPESGMLGASLRHRGAELLGRVDDIDAMAAAGSACGIPLLHPWANRLAGPVYTVEGKRVALDMASPLLHPDSNGLPLHGVPWAKLAWEVTAEGPATLAARLDWDRAELLAVFPFPHRLEISVELLPAGLTVETTLTAGPSGPVPVSFGFHPYLQLPGLPRDQWRMRLPSMHRLALDDRGIPTGNETPFAGLDDVLAGTQLDDGFRLDGDRAAFSIEGGGRRLTVELVGGYDHAQIFTPPGREFLALEPMTAPANALISGQGLRIVPAGASFKAVFRIDVHSLIWHALAGKLMGKVLV
jgi:aldose 1-epimerase